MIVKGVCQSESCLLKPRIRAIKEALFKPISMLWPELSWYGLVFGINKDPVGKI